MATFKPNPKPETAAATEPPVVKASDLAPVTTEAGKLAEAAAAAGQPVFDPTDVTAFGKHMAQRQRLHQTTDRFTLTDKELRDNGINPETHVPYWARNPNNWEGTEQTDRLREFVQGAPGRMVSRGPDGEPLRMHDLTLCAYSKAEAEWEKEQLNADAQEDMDRLAEGHVPNAQMWNAQPDAAVAKQRMSENRTSGIIGPTAGMDWTAVLANKINRMGKPAVEAELRQAAGISGTASRHFDSVKEAQEATEKAQRAAGKKTFSMGATLKDGKVVRS